MPTCLRKRVLSDEEWMAESFQRKYEHEGRLIPRWANVKGSRTSAFKSNYASSLGRYYQDELGFDDAPPAPPAS